MTEFLSPSLNVRPQPSGSLRVAATLAAVAGFVDAHIYVHVTPVFIANMSGNMIHMGIFAGSFAWEAAEGSFVAVLAFLVGVMGATAYHDRRLRLRLPIRPNVLLWVEASMIGVLAVALIAGDVRFSESPVLVDFAYIVLGSAAMGIQTTALRRVRSVQVATTYGTGTIVRIGEKTMVRLASRVRIRRPSSELSSIPTVILVVVLIGYVGGAALAAMLGSTHWWLFLPVFALVVAAVDLRPLPHPPPLASDLSTHNEIYNPAPRDIDDGLSRGEPEGS